MKILIMGTGGVGGYYGGLLAQQGNDVTFIARGSHLYTIRHEGLKVKSVHGDFRISPANATEDPAKVGPVDLILFSVKTYHTEEAAEAIRPAVGPQTAVLSLQNGIDAAERIGKVLGMEHVLGGATWLSSAVE
ncbi:MAG: ketopantoate reductase family protein, partial [Anaerolineales bacterium]